MVCAVGEDVAGAPEVEGVYLGVDGGWVARPQAWEGRGEELHSRAGGVTVRLGDKAIGRLSLTVFRREVEELIDDS